MATRTLPDVEAIIIGYLLTRSEVTDLAGTRIGTKLDPADPAELPAVRIRRVSTTTPVRRHLRAANVQLESWAPDELSAQDLAEIVHAVLLDESWSPTPGPVGVHPGLGVVTGVDESIGPRSQPDPDTKTPRWLSSVIIYCHPELSAPI